MIDQRRREGKSVVPHGHLSPNTPTTTSETTRPSALPVNADGIPDCLAADHKWVVWCFQRRGDEGKWTKPPFHPRTGTHASTDDPSTWTSFEEALAASRLDCYDGVGCIITADDPYAGIDLDDCRDEQTGEIAPWAVAIIDDFASYTEISPSATGVKIWVRGKLPGKGIKRPASALGEETVGAVEMYDSGRYFTVTGRALPGSPRTIAERGNRLLDFYERLTKGREEQSETAAGNQRETDEPTVPHGPTTEEVESALQKAGGPICEGANHRWAWNKAQSRSNAIYHPIDSDLLGLLGTIGPQGRPSPSEVDMAIITALAWRLTPSETYALFIASPRGKDLLDRKGDENLRVSIGNAYAAVATARKHRKRKSRRPNTGGTA